MGFPRMMRIRQKFAVTRIADVPAEVKRELAAWLPKKNAPNAPFDKRTGRQKNKKKKSP
ncbi:MAG: hypothetical protein IID45_04440 [Planctomycetes bacterium]|nr:hypothetical protein [Planctomycetota bacterium]